MANSIDDIKVLRNWAIGIATFATTISAVLVQALHFPVEPTLLCVLGFAGLVLLVVFLISRAESRTNKSLQEHIETADKRAEMIQDTLDEIKDITLENQRASLRIEMGNEMKRHPENHDTIMHMAERYFKPLDQGGLDGNWYMSSEFLKWAKDENIVIPQALKDIIEK